MSVASTRRPSSARTVTASGTATTSSRPSPGTCPSYTLPLLHTVAKKSNILSVAAMDRHSAGLCFCAAEPWSGVRGSSLGNAVPCHTPGLDGLQQGGLPVEAAAHCSSHSSSGTNPSSQSLASGHPTAFCKEQSRTLCRFWPPSMLLTLAGGLTRVVDAAGEHLRADRCCRESEGTDQ